MPTAKAKARRRAVDAGPAVHGPEPNKNHYEEILDRRSADFTEALNSRDVDGGGACYPPTSILVSKSSSTIASFGALKSAALAIL
ncbi:hypothetical protein ARSEF1564_003923 [Beauveria bassiana]